MLQIQCEDDRSRAAAAAAKAAEADQKKVRVECIDCASVCQVASKSVTLLQRKALLFDSAFDNDRDGCMSALGVSQVLCPKDGDGVFEFPDDTKLALAVDTKNAAGATAASEAAVAGNIALLMLLHARCERTHTHPDSFSPTRSRHSRPTPPSQVRTMLCCFF